MNGDQLDINEWQSHPSGFKNELNKVLVVCQNIIPFIIGMCILVVYYYFGKSSEDSFIENKTEMQMKSYRGKSEPIDNFDMDLPTTQQDPNELNSVLVNRVTSAVDRGTNLYKSVSVLEEDAKFNKKHSRSILNNEDSDQNFISTF